MPVYRSSNADLELKEVDLVSLVYSNPWKADLDKPILIDASSKSSYSLRNVFSRTRSLANGLRQLGVKDGDVVVLYSQNSIEYPIICHAIIGLGAVVSPASAAMTTVELRAQLRTSGATLLIAHSSKLDIARAAIQNTSVKKIVQADGEAGPDGSPSAHALSSTTAEVDLPIIRSSNVADKVALMCFSSGTSGTPKGVVTTHRNMTSNIQQWDYQLNGTNPPFHHAVAFLPFSHIYGFHLYLCNCLMRGTTVIVMEKFDLELYLECIHEHRPEELALVPPVALQLLKDQRTNQHDLSSVKRILSAAAPLSMDLASALEQKFLKSHNTTAYCIQGWGLTETSPVVTFVPPHRMDKRGSVGAIVPNMEVRFVDPETLKDVKPNTDGSSTGGEIWCRGPNVTPGYHGNDQATKDAFFVDSDGKRWFRTGDIGSIDREGYIVIEDRLKELIKYKGMQVAPSELEGKLQEHPDVVDAGVIGVWVEEQATELPLAFIVARPGAIDGKVDAFIAQLHLWINERVAPYKKLRGGIHLVPAIPRNPSGKILRKQLKELQKSTKPSPRL